MVCWGVSLNGKHPETRRREVGDGVDHGIASHGAHNGAEREPADGQRQELGLAGRLLLRRAAAAEAAGRSLTAVVPTGQAARYERILPIFPRCETHASMLSARTMTCKAL
jgi:hypothetical protein